MAVGRRWWPVLFGLVALAAAVAARPVPGFWGRPVTTGASAAHPFTAEACGSCHRPQYRGWLKSLHAHSLDAGVRTQLLASRDPVWDAACLTCHAPAAGAGARATGLDCAACHVRGGRRFGPALPRYLAAGQVFHHGFQPDPEFGRSRYCARCHQFPSGGTRTGGVLLENTYAEWRASPYGHHHVACQACHMRGGGHRFGGIHDPAMVRRALTIQEGGRVRAGWVHAHLDIANTGAGHDVPTYTTPRIDVAVEQRCGNGVCPGSERRWEIGRKLSLDLKRQYYDTRIAPGGHRVFLYDAACRAHAQTLRWVVAVRPDAAYVRFFREYLRYNVLPPAARRLALQALHRDMRSGYRLWTESVPLRCASAQGGGQ